MLTIGVQGEFNILYRVVSCVILIGMSMSTKLFVASLSFKMRDEDLREIFAAVGDVVSAKVIISRDGRSKGYGFVEMATAEDAAAAIAALNGTEHFERSIVVAEQNPQEPRSE